MRLVWARRLFFLLNLFFRDQAISHPRSAPGGPGARLGSAIGHSQAAPLDLARLGLGLIFKVGVWCRRDVAFSKKRCAYVDETLVGGCSCEAKLRI